MTFPTISLLLPTRGRPALVARLFESIRTKGKRLDRVQIVLYIDDDDVDSHGLDDKALRITKIIGPRMSMGAYNSACLAKAEGDIAVLINDDMVIRTDCWDEMVRELDDRFPDKIYLGYGNDLFKGSSLCAFPILSRRCCDILVDPFPSAYQGAFIDYHLLDIFKRLQKAGHDRIVYLEDLVFEHMHYRSGKGKLDATYTARRRFGDDDAFLRLRDARSSAAAALIRSINPRAADQNKISMTAATANPQAGLFRATLLDQELPWRWAVRLHIWFLARITVRWILERKNIHGQRA
jgi:hypothetical protein